ncbi:MAG: sugar transferase [Elusimicrobiales bacterium]|nr:sugar transferase [Elusimicrobiales bacterium]
MPKRIFDFTLALIGLVVMSPVLLVCAIAIKLTSPGPVFYRGERIGYGGRIFRTFKFRSMGVDAERQGGASTHEADVRITGIGSFLRRFKLDELPQLINVVTGDMSFVGPRPEVKKFVDMYTSEERVILTVRPGITDWSSIKFHNEGEIIAASGIVDADEAYTKLIRPEKLRLQMKYVRERTLWTDIKIIFDTISTLFRTRAPLKL